MLGQLFSSRKQRDKRARQKGKLFDDLTHLEINTIIRPGMTAAPAPDTIEETLVGLFNRYKVRMDLIVESHHLDIDGDFNTCQTIEELEERLGELQQHLKTNGDLRLKEHDYVRMLRVQSFCYYVRSKSYRNFDQANKYVGQEDLIKVEMDGVQNNQLYQAVLSDPQSIKLQMDTRDRIKIKRMYDLGTENVIIQTRFGLDGDVVTRIEEDFANQPKSLIIEVHQRHTDLSVNYWKRLVELVSKIINEIVR